MPQDFVGPAIQEIVLAGETFKISPITLGQIHALKAHFRSLEPPPIVAVDVEGLVRGLVKIDPEDEEAIKALGGKINWAQKVREDIKEVVKQLVREARGRQEQWPPDVMSELGMGMIAGDERVQPFFVWVMLRKHQGDLTEERARVLTEEADPTEYERLMEAAFATVNAFNQERVQRQLQDPKFLESIQKARELGLNLSGGDR